MVGGFTVVVLNPVRWRDFRAAWSSSVEGVLTLDNSGVRYQLPVVLAAPLPFPAQVPTPGARVEVQVKAPSGVWWLPKRTGDREVWVSNTGDVPVWPSITWFSSGGEVTLPSGASFNLPFIDQDQLRVSLDRAAVGVVTTLEGTPRPQITSQMFDVVAEQVPPGTTRRFLLPQGATLEWQIGVFDPWT